MNSVNPTLASAVQTIYSQANGLSDNTVKDPKVLENTSPQTSSADNPTVTLASKSNTIEPDYSHLSSSQTVNSRNSVENSNVNNKDLTSGSTYASNLQNKSNFFAASITEESSQK